MHFITGGAYNGKTKWVKRFYGLESGCLWLSGFHNEQPYLVDFQGDFAVLQGMDAWIQQDAEKMEAESIRKKWKEIMNSWQLWEKEKQERNCIVIGSDITKGIVPVEANNRRWRDACGWVYQDLVAVSKRVDIVWYGINQQLK